MTEPLLLLAFLIAGTGLVLGGLAYLRSDKRRRSASRRDMASACGLTDVAMDERGTLTGRKGQLDVAMRGYREQTGIGGTRVVIDGLLPDLRLARAGLGQRFSRALGARDLEVGDPVFDSLALLQGPALEVRALFDATTRSAARTALEAFASLRVEGGRLTADCDEATGDPRLVASDLQILLDLGRRLRPPETPASRLAQIAHADPVETVRGVALRTLTEVAPRRPETNEALRVALRDASPALRLQAARALRDDGASTMTMLALADDFAFADAYGAEAMAVLGDRFTVERARPILVRMAATGRVASARTAIEVVARGGAAEVATLSSVLARSSAPIAAAAATALGTIASPSVIAPLRAALRGDAVEVAVAAARALGSCATAEEVTHLRVAETSGGDLGRAAREAIASIQSRLTGASPGQVTLAGGDAGQVSVVDSADGRVSLKTDE